MKNQIKQSLSIAIVSAALSGYAASFSYYSGSIRTNENFRYAKFKARIQGSGQKGTVTSLFTFWRGGGGYGGWTRAGWEEIDVELVPSVQDNPFFTNIIYANQQMDGYYHPNFDPGNDWHEYEIVWKPDYIAWSLDGEEIRRETSSSYSVRDIDKW